MSPLRAGAWSLLAAVCLTATLAVPTRTWRTGRMKVPALTLLSADELPVPRRRVWVDTDAACGHGNRIDADDCLALWLLARSPDVDVVGISTVFGNASIDATNRTTMRLVELLWTEQDRPPVFAGASRSTMAESGRTSPASDALSRALESEPLTVLALGPLTNLVHALRQRPERTAHVDRVIAVMGRRMGHLFHPSEAGGKGSLLGHGPVFRDFNFSMDEHAAAEVLALGVPLTLVPYDAARHVQITSADLDRLSRSGSAGAWIAQRSRGWLDYWHTEIGRDGFYPFDVMAAAYIRSPRQFRCARVAAWVGEDRLMFLPFLRPSALLVGQGADAGPPAASALYCPATTEELSAALRSWLFLENGTSAPKS
jgi:inosine-uridine nucleoside N-ribohydrolase